MKVSDFYIKRKGEVETLAKLKLKLDNRYVMEIEENHCKSKSTEYCSIIQNWRGKIIERTFAARRYKGKPEYQEVMRRIEGNYYFIVKNFYCSSMAGYRTVWSDSRPSCYCFPDSFRNEWLITSGNCYHVFSYRLYKLDDLIEADQSLKYCSWVGQDLIDYVTIYRKYPELEMLSKLGLKELMYNSLVLKKLKEKSFKKFLYGFDGNNFVKGKEVLYCFNHKLTWQQYQDYKIDKEIEKSAKNIVGGILVKFPDIPKDKLYKYIKEKRISYSSIYCDLLEAERFLHLDLTLDKNLFPHDFQYWHDFYTKQMHDALNSEIDKLIAQQAKRYKKLSKNIDGIKLVLPEATNDLIVEGEKLSHCVGRMGYNKKIAKDESLILFVRKDNEVDTPFVTMEYDPHKKQVLQLYAEHDHQPEESIKDLIYNKWLPKVRRLNFA